jgi:hypothetical protein
MANSMEITGTDGSNHLGNIIFVLKLLMIGVDDINQQVHLLRAHWGIQSLGLRS